MRVAATPSTHAKAIATHHVEPSLSSLSGGCAEQGHHLRVFGDMVNTSSDEMEHREVPSAERRVSNVRA